MNLVFLATAWGPRHGGINAFNMDLMIGIATIISTNDQLICIVPHASQPEIADARENNINLIHLNRSDQDSTFSPDWIEDILYRLQSLKIDFWVGHDVYTGEVAILCAKATNSKSTLIHHMAYLQYHGVKQKDAFSTVQKHDKQKEIFQQSDIVFAVGPLLKESAEGFGVHPIQLIPGFPNYSFSSHASQPFVAVMSGRVNKDDDVIKQGRLAVAALSKAILNCETTQPNVLASSLMYVIGLSSQEEDAFKLKILAEKYARRIVNILPLPFSENRNDIFKRLDEASLAFMPSWHEGFGLAGWEAIGAGVPLILGIRSGLYKLIAAELGGPGTGCLNVLDIRGSSGEENFSEDDLNNACSSVLSVAQNLHQRRKDAIFLRNLLIERLGCRWTDTAITFLKGIKYEIPDRLTPLLETGSPRGTGKEHDHNKNELGSNGFISAHLKSLENAFLNESLIPWAQGGIGAFKVIWPNLIVPVPLRDHKYQSTTSLQDWMSSYSTLPNSVIIGAAGSGKSVALRYIFMSLSDTFKNKFSGPIPVYLHASELVHKEDEVKKAIARLVSGEKNAVFLVDGLDEVAVKDGLEIVSKWRKLFERNGRWIFAMRDGFFYSHYKHLKEFDVSIDSLFEILPWQPSQSRAFLGAYLGKTGRNDINPNAIEKLFRNCEFKEFVSNPFQLTLLLFLLTQEGDFDIETPNRFVLYTEFYRHWIAREGHRNQHPEWAAFAERIASAHEHLAVDAYTSRTKRSFAQVYQSISLDPDLRKDPAFLDLLVDKHSAVTLHTTKAGFFHQSILEYFIAKSVVSSLLSHGEIPNIISEEFNLDINSFLRGAFAHLEPNELSLAANRAYFLYNILLSREKNARKRRKTKDAVSNKRSIGAFRAREQLVYLLGRMPDSRSSAAVAEIYKKEPHPLIRRAAALGAILHGNFIIEEEYLNGLQENPDNDILNRSVQLVYFGDVDQSIFEFSDDGSFSWARTRKQTFDRLSHNDKRAIALRWWDLATLRSFFVSRSSFNDLSEKEADILRSIADTLDIRHDPRAKKIQAIVLELLSISKAGDST